MTLFSNVPHPTSEPEAPVTQAVILAGGRGSRLRPYTDDRPKPMVEIPGTGKPILEHQLSWLADAGVTDVVISCGHFAEVLQGWLERTALPLRVTTVVERAPLGRGGGLKFAGRSLPHRDRPWFALNGDIWTRFPLEDMTQRHYRTGAIATVALATPNLPWGVVRTGAEHRVVEFLESPPSPWPINAGVYLFSPSLLDLLPDEGDHERTMFPLLAVSGGLVAYQLAEGASWRAVDTAKDLAAVAAELSSAVVTD